MEATFDGGELALSASMRRIPRVVVLFYLVGRVSRSSGFVAIVCGNGDPRSGLATGHQVLIRRAMALPRANEVGMSTGSPWTRCSCHGYHDGSFRTINLGWILL